MRIISGSKRGMRLIEWEEAGIRPMRDFVRTALFNIVADFVVDSRFLDLFCGTGSVGLEALSRGAAQATFVDRSPKACAIARHNLDRLGFLDRASVLQKDYTMGIDHLERRGKKYNIVFIGPPYDKGLAEECLRLLSQRRILLPDSLIIAEIRNKTRLETQYANLRQIDNRNYGDNSLIFYQPTKQVQEENRID